MSNDFTKGASGASNVYDTTPAGLGITPSYLAGGATASSTSLSGGSATQHNGADVGPEPILDFEDADVTWTLTDDSGNTRVQVEGNLAAGSVALAKLATIPVIGQSNVGWRVQQVHSAGPSTIARTVTFPVAFSAAPLVIPAIGPDGSGGYTVGSTGITAVTASQFTFTNGGSSGADFWWIAFGLV
jgi:hypothetical protein